MPPKKPNQLDIEKQNMDAILQERKERILGHNQLQKDIRNVTHQVQNLGEKIADIPKMIQEGVVQAFSIHNNGNSSNSSTASYLKGLLQNSGHDVKLLAAAAVPTIAIIITIIFSVNNSTNLQLEAINKSNTQQINFLAELLKGGGEDLHRHENTGGHPMAIARISTVEGKIQTLSSDVHDIKEDYKERDKSLAVQMSNYISDDKEHMKYIKGDIRERMDREVKLLKELYDYKTDIITDRTKELESSMKYTNMDVSAVKIKADQNTKHLDDHLDGHPADLRVYQGELARGYTRLLDRAERQPPQQKMVERYQENPDADQRWINEGRFKHGESDVSEKADDFHFH